MLEAATSAPSRDTAERNDGNRRRLDLARTSPAADKKYTLPAAPAVTMLPSGATATAFKGDGRVTIVGRSPTSGQIRTVRS